MRKGAVFLVLGLFFQTRAESAFLIEPYLGYKAYTEADQTLSNNVTKWSAEGPAYGARLGYSYFGLMTGLDYSVGEFELKRQTTILLSTQSTKDKYKSQTFGFFLGYELPLLLRVWGSYFLSSSYEDQDGSNQMDRFRGSGYGAGFGWTSLPWISLNLEIRRFEFDTFRKQKLPQAEIPSPTEILFSVSIPLKL